jgi:hypothetical protein
MAAVIGVAYLSVGIIQVIVALGLLPPIPGMTDMLGGFLLIIVASVFLTGVNPLRDDNREGYAYMAVGYILAAVLFGLQVLVIATNGLGWILGFEDWLDWNIIRDLTPSFWMFIGLAISTSSLVLIGAMRERLRAPVEVAP